MTGSIDLSAGVAGIETENYFVEAGLLDLVRKEQILAVQKQSWQSFS